LPAASAMLQGRNPTPPIAGLSQYSRLIEHQ
jgi:hypothetical protein